MYPDEFKTKRGGLRLPHLPIKFITIVDIVVLIVTIIGIKHGFGIMVAHIDDFGSDAASKQAFWQLINGAGYSFVAGCLGLFYFMSRIVFKFFLWLFGKFMK